MTLKLYNTRTRSLEEFHSQGSDNRVSVYTCGPTVYSYLTVGNWAAYIYWDTLIRTLTANNFIPERVMNITDVGHLVSDGDEGEDKLEKGARRDGKTAWEVAEYYSEDFLSGMGKLGLIAPERIVRATEYIDQQLALIRRLKQKGYTYQITDGLYFDTSKFPQYADFAHLDLESLRAGARVDQNPEKRNASDFAVWKFSPLTEKRDMEWKTPADLLDTPTDMVIMGFPGWHIECSAIALNTLGNTIDIHTGGIDHIPVHHTNEIAQSEAATGVRFANYWLHCNFLRVNDTKISKSLGNGYTLTELEARGYTPLDYRMFILQGQFQNEGNFTFENLTAAKNRLAHWRDIAVLRHQIHDDIRPTDTAIVPSPALNSAILEALNDNLNTPEALRLIDEAFSEIEHTATDQLNQRYLQEILSYIDDILGLQLLDSTPDIDLETKQLIIARSRARDDKDWQEADTIRDALTEKNIAVNDTQTGPIWSYVVS